MVKYNNLMVKYNNLRDERESFVGNFLLFYRLLYNLFLVLIGLFNFFYLFNNN